MNVSVSDWIGIICSAVSLVVTIIIAALQLRQSNRMERFEKEQAEQERKFAQLQQQQSERMEEFEHRQDERDERRYEESVKAKSISFISKYYNDRGLIPLCVMATMYNELFYYNREMYREFCCCTLEVQNRILEYCELDLRISDEKNIFKKCLSALINAHRKHFPKDKDIFYDGGKYIERSLRVYGCEKIPNREFEYENHLTDILSDAFQNDDASLKPIERLCDEYNFASFSEIDACRFTTMVAEYIAIYSVEDIMESDKNYGAPGGYGGETIETMEDLFLRALYEVYIHLVLKER